MKQTRTQDWETYLLKMRIPLTNGHGCSSLIVHQVSLNYCSIESSNLWLCNSGIQLWALQISQFCMLEWTISMIMTICLHMSYIPPSSTFSHECFEGGLSTNGFLWRYTKIWIWMNFKIPKKSLSILNWVALIGYSCTIYKYNHLLTNNFEFLVTWLGKIWFINFFELI